MQSIYYLVCASASAWLNSDSSFSMARMLYCWLPVLCQLSGLQALSLDALARQSSIYYQRVQTELSLNQVAQLSPVESLKLIVHGFLGSRTHSSIQPLRNGKATAQTQLAGS